MVPSRREGLGTAVQKVRQQKSKAVWFPRWKPLDGRCVRREVRKREEHAKKKIKEERAKRGMRTVRRCGVWAGIPGSSKVYRYECPA